MSITNTIIANMSLDTTDSPIDDIAYLVRSEHRVPTLVALTVRPRSRSELWEMAGVSSSTIRRTLTEFEDRGWIRKEGYKYEATELGGFVASGAVDLIERVETEQKLRDVWELLPGSSSDFTAEMCADATVTIADADDPYRPLNRFRELIGATKRFRFVGCGLGLIEPCIEIFREEVMDGMETTLIDAPNVIQHVRSKDPEQFAETLESGNLTVWLHDDLPAYGVGLLDDCTVITGYDPDSGTVRVLVESETAAVQEWAESIYDAYRRQTPTVSLSTTE